MRKALTSFPALLLILAIGLPRPVRAELIEAHALRPQLHRSGLEQALPRPIAAGAEEDPPAFLSYQKALARKLTQSKKHPLWIFLDPNGALDKIEIGEKGPGSHDAFRQEISFHEFNEAPEEYRLIDVHEEGIALYNLWTGRSVVVFWDGETVEAGRPPMSNVTGEELYSRFSRPFLQQLGKLKGQGVLEYERNEIWAFFGDDSAMRALFLDGRVLVSTQASKREYEDWEAEADPPEEGQVSAVLELSAEERGLYEEIMEDLSFSTRGKSWMTVHPHSLIPLSGQQGDPLVIFRDFLRRPHQPQDQFRMMISLERGSWRRGREQLGWLRSLYENLVDGEYSNFIYKLSFEGKTLRFVFQVDNGHLWVFTTPQHSFGPELSVLAALAAKLVDPDAAGAEERKDLFKEFQWKLAEEINSQAGRFRVRLHKKTAVPLEILIGDHELSAKVGRRLKDYRLITFDRPNGIVLLDVRRGEFLLLKMTGELAPILVPGPAVTRSEIRKGVRQIIDAIAGGGGVDPKVEGQKKHGENRGSITLTLLKDTRRVRVVIGENQFFVSHLPPALAGEQVVSDMQTVYDQIAPRYAQKLVKILPEEERDRENFLKWVPKGGKILDAGTGIGRDASWFKMKGRQAVGVDLSAGMLREARKRNPSLPLVRAKLHRLPFADGSFAGVWDNATFHHYPPSLALDVLREYRRVLPAGGILYLRVKRGDGETWFADSNAPDQARYYKLYQPDDLRELVESAGFKVFAAGGHMAVLRSLDWIYLFAQALPEKAGAEEAAKSEAERLLGRLLSPSLYQPGNEKQLAEASHGLLDWRSKHFGKASKVTVKTVRADGTRQELPVLRLDFSADGLKFPLALPFSTEGKPSTPISDEAKEAWRQAGEDYSRRVAAQDPLAEESYKRGMGEALDIVADELFRSVLEGLLPAEQAGKIAVIRAVLEGAGYELSLSEWSDDETVLYFNYRGMPLFTGEGRPRQLSVFVDGKLLASVNANPAGAEEILQAAQGLLDGIDGYGEELRAPETARLELERAVEQMDGLPPEQQRDRLFGWGLQHVRHPKTGNLGRTVEEIAGRMLPNFTFPELEEQINAGRKVLDVPLEGPSSAQELKWAFEQELHRVELKLHREVPAPAAGLVEKKQTLVTATAAVSQLRRLQEIDEVWRTLPMAVRKKIDDLKRTAPDVWGRLFYSLYHNPFNDPLGFILNVADGKTVWDPAIPPDGAWRRVKPPVAAGAEEPFEIIKRRMDAAWDPLKEIISKRERIVLFVDPAILPEDLAIGALETLGRNLTRLNGYPVIEIHKLSAEDGQVTVPSAEYKVIKLRAMPAVPDADPNVVYVDFTPYGQARVSSELLSIFVTDAVAHWRRAQTGDSQTAVSIILPAAVYLNASGVEEQDFLDKILADRFA